MILEFCFLIISLLIVLDAQLQYYEGEQIQFDFCGKLTDIQNCSIEIGRQYGKPFYRDGTFRQASLIGDQKGRYGVVDEFRNIPIKYVVIHNVSRDDGGTYICRAYRMVGEQEEECSKKIVSLTVKYPPGKVNCTIIQAVGMDIHLSRHWQWIKCSAFDGNIPGILRCYQNGRLAPYALRDQEGDYRLKIVKTMWIERGKPFKCCTQVISAEVTEAGCNDFMLDIQPEDSRDPGTVIFSSSTMLPTTKVYFHQFVPHSTKGNVKTIDSKNGVSKFQLEWSSPFIVVVAVLATIPLVIMTIFALFCYQRHRNYLPVSSKPSQQTDIALDQQLTTPLDQGPDHNLSSHGPSDEATGLNGGTNQEN